MEYPIANSEIQSLLRSDAEMAKGCINRICVTDDQDELVQLVGSLSHYLCSLYALRMHQKKLGFWK